MANIADASGNDHKEIYLRLGKAIRQARKNTKMTQEELGVAVGLSRASITNIELGRQQMLLHTVYDIAQALKVPLESLLPRPTSRKRTTFQAVPKGLNKKDRQWIEGLVSNTLHTEEKGE
jgi:transcriptional regulator with XRE-family HTH domain